jgi:hypothetical protein
MRIVVGTLAVMFVASCVCLGVRVLNRRERWAKRMLATVVGLPMLYALSFGPACWLTDWGFIGYYGLGSTYDRLLGCCVSMQIDSLSNAVVWYGEVLSPGYMHQRWMKAGHLVLSAKDAWLPQRRHLSPGPKY